VTPKRLSIAALAVTALVVLVIGLLQLGTVSTEKLKPLTPAQMRARLAGSPPALASLHAQADQILSGGLSALRARLATLRGRPIVINKWASWCGPCRAEFGVFQHAAADLGRQVAFIGIDSGDHSRQPPEAFLRSFPVSYPSYFDPSGQIGATITDSSLTPVTIMYNRAGGFFIHQGAYPSLPKLEGDIRHYALSG
jgi:thiol-disulfide isomerase/thioredoxin